MRELNELFKATDWTEEVKKYKELIKDMDIQEASDYLWQEYYFKKHLSKRAYDWLEMWLDE